MLRTLALALLVFLAIPVQGQTTLKTTAGWGDALRLGRWTPIFITTADPRAQSIDIQIHSTHGDNAAMLVQQTAVSQSAPTTYGLLFPIDADPAHAVAILSDAQSGRTLLKPDGSRAVQLLQNPESFSPAGHTPIRLLAADETLIGLSGNISDAALIQAQLARVHLPSGILTQLSLPAAPVGYEGINALILASADFRNFDGDQEGAIVSWIRRGGNLVVVPGADPFGDHSLLEGTLPCRIGENEVLPLPRSVAATQPSKFNGRQLIPRADAVPVYLFAKEKSDSDWIGYTATVGLGRITVLPANIAAAQFASDDAARAFWRSILAGMVNVPAPRKVTSLEVSVEQEDIIPVGPKQSDSVGRGPRETFAIRHMLDAMNASQSHLTGGNFDGLWYVLGLCALLGPIDSILLMYLGQPPRNWLTLIAWLGLLGTAATLAIKHSGKESARVQTLRIIDQVDAMPVAATDLIAVESNRSRKLPLALDEHEWWEPANQAAMTFSRDRFVDMDFHQDSHGCFPRALALTGGEAQSLRGETSITGSALLDADLRFQKDPATGEARMTGTLTNLSSVPMADIQIAASAGACHLTTLAAGASMKVDQPLSSQSIAFTDLPADVSDVSSDRNDRDSALIAGGRACVYCQMPGAAGVKVVDGVDAADHWQILRAIVPLAR